MSVVLGIAVAIGCGDPDASDPLDDVAALRVAFPEQAGRVLGEETAPFIVAEESFVAAVGDLLVRLPRDASGSMMFSVAAGFSIEVRETGLVGGGAADGGHLRYARGDGAVFWSRTEAGVEEWLHIVSPRPGVIAEWEVAGGKVVQRGPAVVAILDDGGRERMQVSAPEAFGGSGASLAVALEAAGSSRIRLVVDEAVLAEREILIDPLWAAVGSMASPRRMHTATLLPDGKVLVAGGYGLNGALSTCEIWDPRTGRWSAASAMQDARYDHAAVLLTDGSVLVTGGRDASGNAITDSERYEPAANLWVGTEHMSTPRAGHTLTLLRSGKVLAVGAGSTAELFSSSTGTWTDTGAPVLGRTNHTATRLNNGRVLVIGGSNASGYLASAESYNEVTGTFAAVAWLPGPRASHTATLMRDGQVLVAGGRASSSGYLASAYRYDPQTQGFVAVGSLATERAFHTATLLPNNRVLVIGGYNGAYPTTEESFTPTSNLWSSAAGQQSYQHSAVLLHEGRVLVAGGFGPPLMGSVGFPTTLSRAAVENPAFDNDSWVAGTDLPWSFEGTGTLLSGGSALLIGKTWTTSPLTPEFGAWVLGAGAAPTQPQDYKVIDHAVSLMNDGRVFVAGGLHFVWNGTSYSNSGATDRAQIFDPATGIWSAAAPMTHPRNHATATVLHGGYILVWGGIGPNYTPPFDGLSLWLPPPEIYDPATNSWIAGTAGGGRYGHTATLMASGKVLIAGGSTQYDWQNGGLFGPTATAAVFDPVLNTFTNSSMQQARCQHTATSLPDGRVLVAGGSPSTCDTTGSAVTAPMEVLDPTGTTWTTVGSLQTPRMRHTATLLVNGLVLITGGFGNSSVTPFVSTTELVDPATGLSSTSPGLDHSSYLIPTLLQYGGKVAQVGWVFPDYNSSDPYTPNAIWGYDEGRLATIAPTVSAMPASAQPGDTITATGTGFWASSESSENAATDQPRLVLIRHESETQVVAPLSSFAPGTATFNLPSSTLHGWYQARIIVNGVPSMARALHVQ